MFEWLNYKDMISIISSSVKASLRAQMINKQNVSFMLWCNIWDVYSDPGAKLLVGATFS